MGDTKDTVIHGNQGNFIMGLEDLIPVSGRNALVLTSLWPCVRLQGESPLVNHSPRSRRKLVMVKMFSFCALFLLGHVWEF